MSHMLPPESGWPVLDSSLSFTRAQFDSFLSVAVPGGILLGGLGLLAAVATALWRATSHGRWVVTRVVPCMLCYGVVVTTRNVNEAICYLSADIKLPPTLAGSSGRASLAAGASEGVPDLGPGTASFQKIRHLGCILQLIFCIFKQITNNNFYYS